MFISLLISLACVDNVETEVATTESNAVKVESRGPDERTSTPTLPIEETSQAGPEGTDSVRGLLMARHDDDLPGVEVFEAHENVQDSLKWLAENDTQMMVQARALDALGLWDTDDHAAFLLAVATDDTSHAKRRAAAVIGLGHMDLSARADVQSALLALVAGPEERLALESVTVLTPVPEAREALNELASNTDVLPAIAQRLAELSE